MLYGEPVIMHREYDPAERRERYLRSRQLKGRTAGAGMVKKPKVKKATPKEIRAERKAQIEALRTRLERLRKVLAELSEAAQGRSGVEKKDEASEKETSSSSKSGTSDLSSSEKKEKAKKAKEEYEKEKKPLSTQQKELEAKIATTRDKIQKMREDLGTAKRPRARTSSAALSR